MEPIGAVFWALHVNDQKEGERKKIALQAKWCIQNGMKFEFRNEKNIQKGPFHIRNLSVLASRARRFRVSSVNAAQMTVKFMADTGRATISELEECGFFETGRTLDYLADLAKRPCGVKVWDGWKELIIPEYFICNNGSDRGFDIYRLNPIMPGYD